MKDGQMPWPDKGNPQLPPFTGRGVCNFLTTYNRLGDIANATDKSKAGMLEFYCTENVQRLLHDMDCYQTYDWKAIQARLKETYPDDTDERAKYDLEDLKKYVRVKRDINTLQDFSVYYGDFMPYATYLVKRGLITEKVSARYLAYGLPETLRDRLSDIARDLHRTSQMKVTTSATKSAPNTDISTSGREDEIDIDWEPRLPDLKAAAMLHFKKNRAYLDLAAELDDPHSKEEAPEYQLTVAARPAKVDDSKVEDLTRQLAEMRILLAQQQQHNLLPPRVPPTPFPQQPQYPRQQQYQQPFRPPASGANDIPIRPCVYDGQLAGCTKSKLTCPGLAADIRAGIVKIAPDQKRTILFPDDTPVPWSPGRMYEHVKQRQEASATTAAVTYSAPASVSSGHRIYQVQSDGEAVEYEVDAGEKRGAPAEEEDSDTRQVRPRTDAGPRVRFTISGQPLESTVIPVPDETTTPGKAGPRMPASTRWAWVDNDVCVEEVAKEILNSHITLPAKTVISLSPDLGAKIAEYTKKRRVPVPTTTPLLRKERSGDEAMAASAQFRTETDDGHSKPAPYRQPLGKLWVNIGGQDVEMLIDTGAEINLISSKFLSSLKRVIRRPLDPRQHTLNGVTGAPNGIEAICESVLVKSGSFQNVAHFYVCDTIGPCDVLGGLPFLASCNARTYFKKGIMHVAMQGLDNNEYHIGLNEPKAADYHRPTGPDQAEVAHVAYNLDESPAGHRVLTAYKPVGLKVRPLGQAMPEKYSQPRYFRPELPRDPFATPLTLPHLPFVPSGRLSDERLSLLNFGPEGFINEAEKLFLLSILVKHESAIAFDRSEKGCLSTTYASDYEIPVIDHEPWVDRTIPIPKALLPKVIELINKEIASGDLEPSFSAYSTRWFVVPKSDGSLRKVVDASSMNRITIRDVGTPPDLHDFVQDFIGYRTYALADLFSGYDQRRLAPASRDMTTIRTPIGVFRHTNLLQGATNSVAEFQRSVNWVYQADIPQSVRPFVDDLAMKGGTTQGDALHDERFGIREFVWQHGVELERLLFRTAHAGLTISGPKFTVITPALNILGHIVSQEGVMMSRKSMNKIKDWRTPLKNVKELRGFLGTVGAVRQFVPEFARHDEPLRRLLNKRNAYDWTAEHDAAVAALKAEVGQDRILAKLVYGESRPIFLAVDSSSIAAGLAIFQEDQHGVRQPVRFDSIPFTDVESRYSQPKLELCGVYKALRRCRIHLFGQHFTLEVDAQSIVQMLNNPELPSAPMTRWLAYIKLFDMRVVHVPGKDHELVDGLSRAYFDEDEQPTPPAMSATVAALTDTLPEPSDALYESLEEAPVLQNDSQHVTGPTPAMHIPEKWQAIMTYLSTLEVDASLSEKEQTALRTRAAGFLVKGGSLYKKSKAGLHQEVVFDQARQDAIIEAFHAIGHRGMAAVYHGVSQRYWWPSFHKTLTRVVKSCDFCQRRARDHPQPTELLHPTTDTSHLFQKVALDIVHMGTGCGTYAYLLLARDDLSGWVEGRALRTKAADEVLDFFNDEILSRYGPILDVIVNDNGTEFRGSYAAWVQELELDHRTSVAYNPQGHGAIERGHPQIFETICKLSVGRRDQWHKYLAATLYADRITTRRTTGLSAFELVYGALPCLPLDVDLVTWVYTDWAYPMTATELLYQRTRQIVRSEEMQKIAAIRLAAARTNATTHMDNKLAHKRREPLAAGDFVLVHDTALKTAFTRKMANRWYGPFRVLRQHAKGSYFLTELDGTPRYTPVAANRLRQYYPKGDAPLDTLPAELFRPVSIRNA